MQDRNDQAAKFIGIRRPRLATDGEGVTTLAAFWGCPLRCRYCLNPYCMDESFAGEILTPRKRCKILRG